MPKSDKKFVYNSRKKAIFSERRVPKVEPWKMVWCINIQGSAFGQAGDSDNFDGSPQLKSLLINKMIPDVNKGIGKVWIQQQQHISKSQIFSISQTVTKILLLVLTVSLVVVLLSSDVQGSLPSSILMSCLYLIWLSCTIVTVYTYSRQYKESNFQIKIIKQLKSILCEYNNLLLKSEGYIAKCDHYATWICVSRIEKKLYKTEIVSIDSSIP